MFVNISFLNLGLLKKVIQNPKGERGSSVFELVDGLPDGVILQTLLKQPQIQRGLLNTRMLMAFIAMVGQTGSASLWLSSPHGSPLLSQVGFYGHFFCQLFSSEGRNLLPMY